MSAFWLNLVNQFGWLLATVILTIAIDAIARAAISYYRRKKELRDNDYLDVSGNWVAAWQTSVGFKEIIATQPIVLKQKGREVIAWNEQPSTEHPKGGYLWKSTLNFFQARYLMGWYYAKPSENNSSKGIMYFHYRSQHRIFYGKWVGAAYDGDIATGFLVIAKTQEEAKNVMQKLIALNHHEVNIKMPLDIQESENAGN